MRTSALEAYAAHERIIANMHRQLSKMDIKEVDKQATEKKLVDTELKRVQRLTQDAARAAMGSDPRQAYKGVSVVKYKRIMGGNINILTKKKGGIYVMSSEAPRLRNRYRSERTKALQSYAGPSRSFVLRFLESGTYKGKRTAGTKYSSRGGNGNRGIITARHFMRVAQYEMSTSPDRLWKQLEIIFDKQFDS